MKKLLRLAIALALLAGFAGQAWAQTTVTSTTLAAAISGSGDLVMTIASATGWTATTSQAQTYAVIDREVVGVRSLNGVSVGITRGLTPGIRATGHASGAKVWFISAAAMQAGVLTTFDRAGACSTSGSADYSQNATYVPILNPQTGNAYYCTSGGIWLPVTTLMGSNTCTVTQATSKSTGVTCSAMSGTITLNAASLAAAAEVGFTVTNTMVAAGDVVVLGIKSGATAASYTLTQDAMAAGSFAVGLGNQNAGALAEAVVITFVVIKAG